MAVSLESIYYKLKAADGQQIELAAGEKGINRIVKWVHIVETDSLTSFLEGNELVFTTGITLKNAHELTGLVKKVFESKASGIVINTGPYIKEIPEEIKEFCNNNDFPLFEVPWEVYLGKTMKICAEEITRAEQSGLEISAALQNAVYNPDNYNLYVPILEKHGFDSEFSYCVALFDFVSFSNSDLTELTEKICGNIENSLAFYSVKARVFSMGNRIAVLFVNQTDERVCEITENIKSRAVLPENSDIEIYIGIGRNTKSIRCIHKTYKIALKVVELQKKKHRKNEVLSYRNMGFSKIFLAMDDYEIMQEYYNDILKPLVEYDSLNGTDLTEFLTTYFETGASVKDTAEKLFLHRNTVNYKLNKIQDILKCDFRDFNIKTEILIALKLKELL